MRSPIFPTLPMAGLALTFLSPFLSAQSVGGTEDVKYRFDSEVSGDQMGFAVSGAGDVDGEGFNDVIVGADFADPNGLSSAGSAFVFPGSSGAQIWRLDGLENGSELGYSVACAGDVDGDGLYDVMVGAPYASPNSFSRAGSAFVFSGATGAQIFRFDGLAPVDLLGFSVAGAGDVDGDGVPDLVAGAPFADPNGLQDAGPAFVFSGATGVQLWRIDGKAAGDSLGFSVSGAGDVDGDGFHDVIVGAPNAALNGDFLAGWAFVFSGATGAPLLRFHGIGAGDFLGYSVGDADDVDGDGSPDLIVGAFRADPNGLSDAGSAFVFSGATGAQLFRLDGSAPSDLLGYSVAGAGDVDGDGRSDLIVGAPSADPNSNSGAGSAFVFTFNSILTSSAETFSISAGGTIDYASDFPTVGGGENYGILLSAHGMGPTLFRGLLIPLQKDRFFLESTKGNTPPQGIGFQGILGLQGQATAHFTAAPGSLPTKLIGRSLFLAAVSKKLDFASVARRIDFVP